MSALWVSEVMLQQTRVGSVGPYFERFIARFPDVHALAVASIDAVLGAWSGLGYYRRARALHEAANQIVVRFGGRVPSSLPDLLSLAGVGPYTASAIASIAFGVPAAVVDGNVSRVVARLFDIRTPINDGKTKAAIARHASRLLDEAAPGAFNEAMMDLGAVVCTPRAPSCLMCPASAWCAAFHGGQQESLPVTPARRVVPRVEYAAFVAMCEGRLLLARRRSRGLFGGMWEPLMLMGAASDAKRSAVVRGIAAPRWLDRGAVEHVLTHRVLEVRVFAASLRHATTPSSEHLPSDYEAAAWCTQGEAATRGLSVLARKVIACAAGTRQVDRRRWPVRERDGS